MTECERASPRRSLSDVGVPLPCVPPRPACTLPVFCLQARLSPCPGCDLTPRSVQEKQSDLVTAQPWGEPWGWGLAGAPARVIGSSRRGLGAGLPGSPGHWPLGALLWQREAGACRTKGSRSCAAQGSPGGPRLPGLTLSVHPPKVPTRRRRGSGANQQHTPTRAHSRSPETGRAALVTDRSGRKVADTQA